MTELIFPVTLAGFFFLAGVALMILGLTPGSADEPTRTADKKKPAEAGLINAEDIKRVSTGSNVRDTSLKRHG
ncbi:hypothetical protein AAIH70_25590 [Neorhizobium sp. BT27B]|uniref:hypothetical protein n=1 Tax=Neorhizobium sp. BT27B TaxID=3142625 RepID=UPI003D2D2AD9